MTKLFIEKCYEYEKMIIETSDIVDPTAMKLWITKYEVVVNGKIACNTV